jgi:hypothetical protein
LAGVIDDNESELNADVSSLMNTKYAWSNGLVIELAPL